jgi:signal transduction histidine kinase
VSNGQEALESILRDPPDLVLTDVMMPVLDGFGLLAALRKEDSTKTLPILMLSARAGEESRVEGLDAGADDYLVKPFTARELVAKIDAHLSLSRMRKDADQARRLSEVRLELVLEATRMVAWEWDPHKDELKTVGDMAAIFGSEFHSSAEGFKLVHPEDAEEHRAKVERVATEGGYFYSEFRIVRPQSGAVAWLAERATAILDDSGRVACLVGVIADVTDAKAAADEIRRKNEELTKVNRELEEFAYVASHDLQEPLRMVNIYSQLLLRRFADNKDPKAIEYCDHVSKGVTRMEDLIKDLLQYSRVIYSDDEQTGGADLNVALQSALNLLEIRIKETGATVETAELPRVNGDERQFAIVFQNLLSNALKYRKSDEQPHVRVTAEPHDSGWTVKVKDNGIGFSPVHADRIFGLFKRLHKDEYPGTGLGLAICKRVIERYGGHIQAHSDGEGLGAEFLFTVR